MNTGTPDSVDGTQGVTDIADHARTWARGSGFSDRFPAATVSVQEGEERAVARFDEGDHRRAELAYRKVTGGWAIDTMTYC